MTDLDAFDAALATLRARGTAARRLLDGANRARRERAATVKVAWSVARNGGGVLVARVLGNEEYAVRIDLDRATFNCTCPDHGRVGACKHTLAVTERWVVNFARPEWVRLTEGRAALVEALDAEFDEGDEHPEDMAETLALRAAEATLGY
jgi:uncharacterized Zn finger protein